MLYLASQSPRRRWLLKELGLSFKIVRSTHRETIRSSQSPEVNAMRNAIGKAKKAILPNGACGWVIGADTFLWFQGRVIGKPRNMKQAWQLMRALSGRSHWVYTGLCLLDVATRGSRASFDRSRVTFHSLSDSTIKKLFQRCSPLDKAGGYALQADRGDLIAGIEGSRSNVIGLPLELLRREIKEALLLGTPPRRQAPRRRS